MWANTWRYIDDLFGFGDRRWDALNYGMEHKDTSLIAHKEVVFLGMHVKRGQSNLLLEVWQKGTGWQWKPQRFIEYTSCHTPWTKKFLLKSLLVRAATICSTTAGFKRAVEHYVQGLLARGCATSHLQKSWDSFASSRLKNRWTMRNELSAWFRRLISGNKVQPPSQQAVSKKRAKHRLLLCGLNAVNAVLAVMERPLIAREQLDDLNDNLAVEEALVLDEGEAMDNATDPRGNYPVDVLMAALRTYADCKCERLKPQSPSPGLFLVGNGLHWQVVAANREGHWSVYDDGLEFPVADVHSFFRNKFHNGAVIQLSHPLISSKIGQPVAHTSEFMDIFGSDRAPPPKRKAEGEHEDAPAGQAITIEDDSEEPAPSPGPAKTVALAEPAVDEHPLGGTAETSPSKGASPARQSRGTKKRDDMQIPDSSPRTRSRSKEANSMPPPSPRTLQSNADSSTELTLPCVECSNLAVVPSVERRSVFEVVNRRCLNCCKLATTAGHQPSEQVKVFNSKDEKDAFVHAFWIEDDNGGDGTL